MTKQDTQLLFCAQPWLAPIYGSSWQVPCGGMLHWAYKAYHRRMRYCPEAPFVSDRRGLLYTESTIAALAVAGF